MAFIKGLFTSPKAPSMPKPPTQASGQIQGAEDSARRAALLSRGRGSTIVAGNNLGNVG